MHAFNLNSDIKNVITTIKKLHNHFLYSFFFAISKPYASKNRN